MKILTCIARDAKIGAIKHNLLPRLRRLLYSIEEDQTVALLTPFPDRHFFKKMLVGSNYRVLVSRHRYDGYIILCAFMFTSRSNTAYDVMWKKIRNKPEPLYQKIKQDNETLFIERIKTHRYQPTLPPLPKPSHLENLWLSCYSKASKQVTVIETKQWIKTMATDRFKQSGDVIHSLLQSTYANIDDAKYQANNLVAPFVKVNYLEGAGFRLHLQYFPTHHLLFLLDLTDTNTIVSGFDLDASFEALTQDARRSYSLDAFVLNADEFSKVQNKDESNLALSPEEANILNHIGNTKNNNFPLFINGRAGSGKSTILQYLLKDYLYLAIQHWRDEKPYTPLYLTYSKKLLDFAKRSSYKLLNNNVAVLLKKNKDWEANYQQHHQQVFDATFKLFQDFMVSLLPEKDRVKFSPDKQITYARFKQLWDSKIGRGNSHQYNVDLVWHIIRTYIKGMSGGLGSNFTPEDYALLPEKYKTIEDQDFAEIYKKIWKNWYLKYCQEHKAWDQQDLALTVLAKAEFASNYPAIFCDEAQDFTVIELKILYHLSLFSKRNVAPHQIGSIPFVFAGDPLQTLNPTGFRWEAVKASFYDYLIAPIERRNNKNSQNELNYKELVFNYRSSKNIVDFCNIIQLLRLCLFGNTYRIKPQLTWFSSKGMTPFVYPKNSPKAQQLLEHAALIIIPNCHESEESEYVKNDPILRKSVDCDETGVPLTVLSPSSAKGLEYSEIVVLYCFGESCPKGLLDRLQGKTSLMPDPKQLVKWEYFLNRLYVAVSRAKQRLIILDNPKTFETFWNVIQHIDAEGLAEHLGTQVNTKEWRGDKLLTPKQGTDEDMDNLLQGRALDDLEGLAKKFYTEGFESRKPKLLRRARMLYQRLDKEDKALQCYAPALEFEQSYTEAAKAYLQIDNQETALRCLWKQPDFTFIAKTQWDNASNLQIMLAHQLEYQKNQILKWKGDLKATSTILKLFDNSQLIIHGVYKGWQQSLTALFNWFSQEYQQGLSLDEHKIWKILEQLEKGIDYKTEDFAVIAYKLKRYKNALALWDDAGKKQHKLYYQCQYKNSVWPHSLRPLQQLNDFKKIIAQWQDRGKDLENLSEKYQVIVIEAMIHTDKQVMAANLLHDKSLIPSKKLRKKLSYLLWQQINTLLRHSSSIATDVIGNYLDALIDTQSWKDIPPLLNKVDSLNKIQYPQIDQKLIKYLAYSDPLENASLDEQALIFNLLEQRFYEKDKRKQWFSIVEQGIGIAMMGIVIERTCYYTKAKEYYFWITRYAALKPAEHGYFNQRIAVCLQKEVDIRHEQGKASEREESKIRDLKKKLGIDYIDPDVTPGHYPEDEILSPFNVRRMREKIQPTSNNETIAKSKINRYWKQGKEKKWLGAIEGYTEILAENEKWDLLARDWCHSGTLRRYYPKSGRRQRQQALEGVIKAIINTLSCSDSVLDSSGESKMKFSNLLIEQLKNKEEGTWSHCDRLDFDRNLVGSCLERVGEYKETINFYQWRLNEADNAMDEKLMAERLIVSKERFADFIAKKHKENRTMATLRQEATKLRDDYQFQDKKLPEYPSITC